MTLDIRKMHVIGAFDRFNYGDLLFPVVVNKYIEDHFPGISLEAYGLISSDYSQYGALKTKPIRHLYRPGVLKNNDIIYFAGGGTIGSDYFDMLSHLMGRFGNKIIYYFERVFGLQVANYFSRKYFGGKSPFPWVASPGDYSVPVKVIYNSIGGSEFSALDLAHQKTVLKILSEAAYLSVRDAESKKQLEPVSAKIPIILAPDSATLMAVQFPRKILEGKVGMSLRGMAAHSDYACFQCNKYYAKKYSDDIVRQLENIYQTRGLRTLLLPIGRYVGLDDYEGLLDIMRRIKTPVDIVSNESSIWDIMHTIASSRIFIGTSLHGNITAQSFAVPHIGLSERRSKVDYYLETWDIPEYSSCIPISNIHKVLNNVISVSGEVLRKKSEDLATLAINNIEKMMHLAIDS